ncbi:2509_t:CDS:2 [Diversispora eburnea]|uniref:2509_t:CDS:1 n=1 Tax=Diversispora eburnea TaxID=1213867 RepID=A0A9N9G523_9GLOM|nr:2509_t:CDS:2 [Diversispora eburnea]
MVIKKNWPCDRCGKTFPKYWKLIRHLNRKNPCKPKPYISELPISFYLEINESSKSEYYTADEKYKKLAKLRIHLNQKNLCQLKTSSILLIPSPNPEIDYLNVLGLFDSSEIGENSHLEVNSPSKAEREYLEAL